MTFKIAALTIVCLGGLAAQRVPNKRQVGTTGLLTDKVEDHVPAETGFAGPAAAVHQGSKFFQYTHMPGHDQIENGHKRGNDHHFIERHEKERPSAGEFKTKVRWGDKHGGYGEHYWDYNHAGHGNDGDGGASQHNGEYAEYEEESKTHPVISSLPLATDTQRSKREPIAPRDVEFINDKARALILDGSSPKHGGNYRALNDYRGKREQTNQPSNPRKFGESLVFDPNDGVVVDEETGFRYKLNPIR